MDAPRSPSSGDLGVDEALRESEQRYRALVNALPQAILVHDGVRCLFANPAAVRLVGAATLEEVIDRPVLSFAHPDSVRLLEERTRGIILRGEPAPPIEVQVIRQDGSLVWVEATGVRVDFGGRPASQTMLQDVSARRQREDRERALAARLQWQSTLLLRLATDPLLASGDFIAGLRLITEHAARTLGVDSASVWLFDEERATLRCLDRYDVDLGTHRYDTDLAAELYPDYFAALNTDRAVPVSDAHTDPRTRSLRNDYLVPFNVGALLDSPVRLSGQLIGVMCLEQHARGRAWEPDEIAFAGGLADQVAHAFANAESARAAVDIRILAGKLMQLQDEERRRIGRELHDSTGQVLAALEMTLDRAVAAARALDPKVTRLLSECSQLARQCSQEIRTAAYLLHPPLLDELGLPTALRWLVDGFTARSSIPVQLELPTSSVRLEADLELSLFRVVQEALSNIQKHSGSKKARVRLVMEPERVSVEVRDFGRGLPALAVPAVTQSTGVGLAGMRERLRQLGGNLSIESDATGTSIIASVPLLAAAPA
ncbi:MAG TPA: GAF domain-containing protein [Steroidobacteraceae bacterium]|nr:GAF domain-containing protein [Steroidobacteraceae bacterium]